MVAKKRIGDDMRELLSHLRHGVPWQLSGFDIPESARGKLSKADIDGLNKSLQERYRIWASSWIVPKVLRVIRDVGELPATGVCPACEQHVPLEVEEWKNGTIKIREHQYKGSKCSGSGREPWMVP